MAKAQLIKPLYTLPLLCNRNSLLASYAELLLFKPLLITMPIKTVPASFLHSRGPCVCTLRKLLPSRRHVMGNLGTKM